MEITDIRINNYIDQHTSEPSALLNTIERETYLKSIYPRMLSGKVQGRFIAMISKMLKPKSILEVGTFTGYSAICLAEGLATGGEIHTIEINEELKVQNDQLFQEAGLGDVVHAHYGNALDIIQILGTTFDLAFIDADKINYKKYYELTMGVLKPGGYILADNVLWSGKVLDRPTKKADKDTEALIEFNALVQRDKRVENVMIPLRDGMTLIRKI